MKLVAISQRVDRIDNYGETRDALDEQWHKLFWKMNAALIPIPNFAESLPSILGSLRPEAIVLSGGNNPVPYGGTAPQRDQVDMMLIEYAVRHSVPLLGVCRGMQSIALYFGCSLKRVEGHVATKHEVIGEVKRVVNSYHSYAIDRPSEEIGVTAQTKSGDIEAIQHRHYRVCGIMWHPERVDGFNTDDISLMAKKLAL